MSFIACITSTCIFFSVVVVIGRAVVLTSVSFSGFWVILAVGCAVVVGADVVVKLVVVVGVVRFTLVGVTYTVVDVVGAAVVVEMTLAVVVGLCVVVVGACVVVVVV